jgi:hypothetical protein
LPIQQVRLHLVVGDLRLPALVIERDELLCGILLGIEQ